MKLEAPGIEARERPTSRLTPVTGTATRGPLSSPNLSRRCHPALGAVGGPDVATPPPFVAGEEVAGGAPQLESLQLSCVW